jgi:predicted outer membrane repeat protein
MFAVSAPAPRRVFASRVVLLMSLFFGAGVPAYAATCVVTSTNSGGPGSLANCLSTTPSGGTIDASGVAGVIHGNFEISKDVTIQGPASGQLTIGEQPHDLVFTVDSNRSLTLSNVTVTGGAGGFNADQGSTLTLINTTVTKNTAVENGGGIFAEGTVILINSTVSNNRANADSSANGGGIFIVGSLTLIKSTVTGNTAAGVGGGMSPVTARGFTLHRLAITDCVPGSCFLGKTGSTKR